jgi:Predicted transcriptional regulator
MRVDGDSMSPEIRDGDVVLIDQSQSTPQPSKIFAVGVEDMIYSKK